MDGAGDITRDAYDTSGNLVEDYSPLTEYSTIGNDADYTTSYTYDYLNRKTGQLTYVGSDVTHPAANLPDDTKRPAKGAKGATLEYSQAQDSLPLRRGIDSIRIQTRPAARLGLAPDAGHLFDPGKEALIAECVD